MIARLRARLVRWLSPPPVKVDSDAPLTLEDVEAIALRRSDDADMVRLAMAYTRAHHQHQKDIAMLDLELTDALSRAPAQSRGMFSTGGDA